MHADIIFFFFWKCVGAITFIHVSSPRSPPVYLHRSPRRRLLFLSSALISVSSHLVSSSFLSLLLSVHAQAARLTLFPPGFGNHTEAATWLRPRQQPPVLSLPSGKSLERSEVTVEGNWHDELVPSCEGAQLYRLYCFCISDECLAKFDADETRHG